MTSGYYHLHVHPISRRKGHHIEAAVAYRHGTRSSAMEAAAAYRQARTTGNGPEAFDYRRKIGVAWTGLIAPDNVPPWMTDTASLWRAVDAFETRANARLAQEIVIGLPHQVDLEQHIAMLTAFTKAHCVDRYRLIADIAIHAPPVHQGGDPRHWHAHILLTDRPADAQGFTRTKDRRTAAKDFVDELRAAWTQTHNTHMQALGLPYRIDHRTLAAQRQDAIAQNDTVAALDLDREPQIRLGKAVHASHSRYAAFAENRARNRHILAANKERAAQQKDCLEAAIAETDTAAYLEGRRNAWAAYEARQPTLADLERLYGRPRPSTLLGRLTREAHEQTVVRDALALSRRHGHLWRAIGHHPDAPNLLHLLMPRIGQTGPGHPTFTVTAKDLAFAFYRLGFIDLPELQQSLDALAQEEHRLFPRKAQPPPSPWRTPPRFETPEAARLKRLQKAAQVPRNIYRKRLAQLTAFDRRYQQRLATTHSMQARMRRRTVPPPGQT